MAIFNTVYGGEPKWKPWANTLAYRPLTDDFNDHSWNSYNLTSNSVNLTTLSWVKCADLNSSYCNVNLLITTLPYTMVFWCKAKWTSNTFWYMWKEWWSWWGGWIMLRNNLLTVRYWNPTDTVTDTSYTYWTDWHLYVLTFSSSWCNIYIDGDLIATPKTSLSNPTNNLNPLYIWHDNGNTTYWNAYVWWVVLENKVRTADEISKYYNQTKSNYWL